MPALLQETEIWWNGPAWLKSDQNQWPVEDFEVDKQKIQERKQKIVATAASAEPNLDMFEKFSSFNKLIRVMARANGFSKNTDVLDQNFLKTCP